MKLELGINQVSNGATLIGKIFAHLFTVFTLGEQLESLDKQKARAQDAKDIISHFIEFDHSNPSRLSTIRKSDKKKAMEIIKQLYSLSKEIDLDIVQTARTGIQEYYEMMEVDVLDDFDQAYKDGLIEEMTVFF